MSDDLDDLEEDDDAGAGLSSWLASAFKKVRVGPTTKELAQNTIDKLFAAQKKRRPPASVQGNSTSSSVSFGSCSQHFSGKQVAVEVKCTSCYKTFREALMESCVACGERFCSVCRCDKYNSI